MTPLWTRRTFLRAALGATLGTSLPLPFDFLEAAIAPPLDPDTPRKRVVILGAGLAGLSAAFELQAVGHDVIVLEARTRPGGRVVTIRDCFADGLHAEVGATRIASTSDWTMKYVKQFGLELVPFRQPGLADVYYIRGKRLVAQPGKEPEWPVPLTDEERSDGLSGMTQRYINAVLPQIGDAGIPDGPPSSLRPFDAVRFSEWLHQRGASQGALELFMLGASEDISALQRLRALTWRNGASWWKIGGGNDRLPKAFAEKLTSQIRYGCAARRIRHDEKGVTIAYEQAGRRAEIQAEHAICTIPFSVLRNLDVAPLSDAKRRALDELPYPAVTKLAIQTRTRFWRAQGLSGFALTDLPVPETWDLSTGQTSQRGLLLAYLAGPHAKMPQLSTSDDKLQWSFQYLTQIFPGIQEEYEAGISHNWAEDPWALGAYPMYAPTQVIDLFPAVRQSEGRLHFAGDHASAWPGWMQGALESGNRAARIINAAVS